MRNRTLAIPSLALAGALAVASVGSAATVSADDDRPAPSKTVRWGVIGTGGIAKGYALDRAAELLRWIDLNGCVAACETGYRSSTVYTGVTGPVTTVACTSLGTVMAVEVSCRHFYL